MQSIVFGEHDEATIRQWHRCLSVGQVTGGVLCADGHYGYSQPVGGVIAYDGEVSPSGVGYDIACGNFSMKLDAMEEDVAPSIGAIMDDIASHISFGIGRKTNDPIDHAVFEEPEWAALRAFGDDVHDELKRKAYGQLGTVGAGNHFVDVFVEDETGSIWIANHFGSRGFGHTIASGFLNIARGRHFFAPVQGEPMDQRPTLLSLDDEIGALYMEAMTLAGKYAYAGREIVLETVRQIIGAQGIDFVHNHHNYAWKEVHDGHERIVVRKGATPAAPGQRGFIGGSMTDHSVIVRGKETPEAKRALYSTVHGAGRLMSRTEAAGRMNWKTKKRSGGQVSERLMQEAVRRAGVELRGGGPDESPFVYRPLRDVLRAHEGTIAIEHVLRPIGVAMAGANESDPYKD